MNDNLPEEDKEFDEKVYSALNKKLLPELKLDENKGYKFLGTLVLAYLLTVTIAVLVNSYTQKQYHQNLIEFRE